MGLSLAPACLSALPWGCAGSVSGGCFPLVAAAWPLPGLGFPHGLCRDDHGFPRWCGLRVSLPDALLQLGVFSVGSVGSKNHQPPLLPRGAVCADGGRGQLQHHVPLYGVARCSWAEVPELPTYSCWFPLPLLLTFIILLISSAESKFVRSRFQKASKCQFW